MSARLGTRVVAGVFGVGLLLGSVASATAALPGALLGGGAAQSTPSATALATPVLATAAGNPGQVTRSLRGTASAPLGSAGQAARSAASQAADTVGPKVTPPLEHALAQAPGLPLPGPAPVSGPSGSAGPLGSVTDRLPTSLPAVGDLSPLTGPLGQARQLLGPAVGALLDDTPLSTSGGSGFAPLSNSVGTSAGGLPVSTGSVTNGLTGTLAGR